MDDLFNQLSLIIHLLKSIANLAIKRKFMHNTPIYPIFSILMNYTNKEVYEFISKQNNDPIVERKVCTVS